MIDEEQEAKDDNEQEENNDRCVGRKWMVDEE